MRSSQNYNPFCGLLTNFHSTLGAGSVIFKIWWSLFRKYVTCNWDYARYMHDLTACEMNVITPAGRRRNGLRAVQFEELFLLLQRV